ncbi:UDP-N-acetylmuramoylalanyl-D-glutamate-2,6-diaminopimelate ligase [Lysobacter dokdonensis DS-58]|uniref:UDP-N-acetylmuramoyl-L-alanyl-D-glutamate--2,6-diaminopimelate ligase n=1 Tax=Lysobacter dokdonensis DS-58 TaxID=1300345 RepID=A0A0A2WJH7_9GAMM|nr:UDP-N-acetylmuramoyl-L-alanyl-D-glutamate--2,6-diaminopimelate ligase [Lysobacter dokdonensis]KGQ18877.1 UDP-N-acetylmuramoylalanyl-D-glutamate-2,6-diaminopimelate ligase [Lysobacter dokdonensis DS-58]
MTRAMRLAQLLPDVADVPADLEITGLVMDSRAVKPGDAFVAIAGFGAHGLLFAEQAKASGARAVLFEPPAPENVPAPADAIPVPGLRGRLGELADRFHDFPSHALTTVGVTGTNGKTSTVQLLAQAWTLLGTRAASIGTLGAGLYGDVVPTGFTTPLVLQVHQLIAQLRDQGAQALSMEVSSHALDQGRVAGVHFDVGVFTNLTRDHLDYHGDMASYGAAKAKLFGWPDLRAAVINIDDDYGRAMFDALPKTVRHVGTSARGDRDAFVRAENITLDNRGVGFELIVGNERLAVRSPLLGRFNVDNLLAVAGTLIALDHAPAQVADVLSRLQPIHGRMNRLGGQGDAPLVVVDYAHTPDALEQALTSLRAHAAAKLACVFGCGGERDTGKRPQMAAIAERLADRVIVTDDNPRGENGDTIVEDIVAGFSDALRHDARLTIERDRAKAIARAVGEAGPNDIVLIAGKGHEPYQEIDGVRHAFDDTLVARQALEARA